ncbi:MAG: YceI family protein [Pseudomonadota bacterium]
MLRIVLSTALIAAVNTAHAQMAQYELDPEHTTVYFTIDHIGYAKTLGLFTDVSGQFSYDASSRDLGRVEVTIDAGSVTTFNGARDKHVKNSDFLHVTQHPEITFLADEGQAISDTAGTVTGALSILGQIRPVTLDVTLNKVAAYPFGHRREVLGLSMTASINRSDFGMSYGVANGLVGDEVKINIETEAIRME